MLGVARDDARRGWRKLSRAATAASVTVPAATADRRIEVRIDRLELLEVVVVRMLVRRRVVRVVHAGPEIRIVEILVLMIETPRVSDFLAHHELSPLRCVVAECIRVVRVVQLHRGLRDVVTADPDLRDAEPAVLTVRIVADFHATRGWTAPGCGAAGSNKWIDHILVSADRRIPVADG